MVIVLMGPMGCGKTTIGELLAKRLDWTFLDGDDFHPEANKIKMGSGVPLDDDDRKPWLLRLRQLIDDHLAEDKGMILACSALKKSYRSLLGIDQSEVCSVFLQGSASLLRERIAARSHEYMARDLLTSQLDTLEEPQTGLSVDISGTPEQVYQRIITNLPHVLPQE